MNDPFKLFAEWYAAAAKTGIKEPTAMQLATADKNGAPSVRVVLLKAWDERGFVFYTNANSRKGKELTSNPQAALNFYWMDMERQIRIEGSVEEVKGKEADDYYDSRQLERRFGAWASKQSEVLKSRDDLITSMEELKKKYGENPPRPPYWHGFRIVPKRFEFWQEGAHRLHQRDVYERDGNIEAGKGAANWKHFQIYP